MANCLVHIKGDRQLEKYFNGAKDSEMLGLAVSYYEKLHGELEALKVSIDPSYTPKEFDKNLVIQSENDNNNLKNKINGVSEKVEAKESTSDKKSIEEVVGSVDVYAFQDENAERIISERTWNNNEWRYKLENAGDVLRELAKYKNQFLDPSYIYEKIDKIDKYINKVISNTINKDRDVFLPMLADIDIKNAADLRKAYEEQPVLSEAQAQARQLALNMIDGKYKEAQKQIDYFNSFRNDKKGGAKERIMAANEYKAKPIPTQAEVTSDKKSIEKVKVKDLEVGDEVVLKGKEGTWKVDKKTKDGVDLTHTTKQGAVYRGADDGDVEGKVVIRSENVTQTENSALKDVEKPILKEEPKIENKIRYGGEDKDLKGNPKRQWMKPKETSEQATNRMATFLEASDYKGRETSAYIDKNGENTEVKLRNDDGKWNWYYPKSKKPFASFGTANDAVKFIQEQPFWDNGELNKKGRNDAYFAKVKADAIKTELENGNILEDINDGKISAKEAKSIIESAGLEVPKSVESLLSKEQTQKTTSVDNVIRSESNPALRDVESTAKALSSDTLSEETVDAIEDLYLKESGTYRGFFTRMGDLLFTKSKGVDVKNMTLQSLKEKGIDPIVFNKERNEFLRNNEKLILSEYYHKAKREKIDAELVKAVESLLSKEQQKVKVEEPIIKETVKVEQPTSTTQSESNPALRDVESTAKMPKEISDLYEEAASLRFTLNALKMQMGGKDLVGKSKAEFENTKIRLENIELKLSEYEKNKSTIAKPTQSVDKKEVNERSTIVSTIANVDSEYGNFLLNEIDKKHKEKYNGEDIKTGLAKQFNETLKDRGENRAISNLEDTYMNYVPTAVRAEAYQALRKNFEKSESLLSKEQTQSKAVEQSLPTQDQTTSDNNINQSETQPDGFDKAADATIEALNKLKIIDTKSTDKRMGMDGEKIIRAAFDASRVIYHASKSLAEAIKKALQTVRDSDWYKNLSGDQKSDIDNLVRAQLNAYAKENVVAEPLPELDWDMQDQDVKEEIIINAQNLIESEEFKDYKEFSLRLKELYGLKESDAKTIYDSLVEHINVQTEDPFSIALRGKGAVTKHMNNTTLNESSEDEIGNRTYLANSFAEMNEDIDAVFNRIRAANPKNWEKIIADKILERLDAREMQAAIFADRFVTFINNYLADHQRSPNYTEKAREYKKYRIEILRRRQKFTQEFATYFAKLQQLKLHNPLTMLTEQGLLDANQMKAAKEMDEQLKGKKEYDASGKPKPFVEDSKLDKAPPTSDKKEKETKKASKAEVKKNVLNALKNAKDNAADLAIKITKIPC